MMKAAYAQQSLCKPGRDRGGCRSGAGPRPRGDHVSIAQPFERGHDRPRPRRPGRGRRVGRRLHCRGDRGRHRLPPLRPGLYPPLLHAVRRGRRELGRARGLRRRHGGGGPRRGPGQRGPQRGAGAGRRAAPAFRPVGAAGPGVTGARAPRHHRHHRPSGVQPRGRRPPAADRRPPAPHGVSRHPAFSSRAAAAGGGCPGPGEPGNRGRGARRPAGRGAHHLG